METPASIFRAYDIRGVVGETLTPELVREIGHAVGSLYPASPRVAVGYDGRLSSAKLAEALCEGLMAAGRTAISIGQVATPVLYFATHHLDTGAGIMITGSHNPPEYNGLKLVMDGHTLHGDAITAIHDRIVQGGLETHQGKLETQDLNNAYLDRICSDVKVHRPLRVAIDAGNGAAGPFAKLFDRLGCEVTELYCDVDGSFPNHHPNPSELETLSDLIDCVTSNHLDVGIAFDGDGDRIGVVDDQGEVIWADRQMMLYSADVLSRNPGAEILYDVKSSRNLEQQIVEKGGRALMCKTGHSFIKAKMKETGALLAGEMSGHIFFKERWYGFDDALYAAARLLEILSSDLRTSHEIFEALPNAEATPEIVVHFPEDNLQHEFMRSLSQKADFGLGKVNDIDGLRVDYPEGWGLVRASNTTPSIVMRFEANNRAHLAGIQAIFRTEIMAVDSAVDLPF